MDREFPTAKLFRADHGTTSVDLRRRRVLLAGLAGAGMLAGCGGSDDNAGPTSPGTPQPGTPAPGGGLGATPPAIPPSTGVRFQVSDRQILRNGQPFFAKGICYSPQPIGATFDRQPWGDFFSDFWQPVFARDLPLMRAMGVNSIRLYSTLPFELIYDANSARVSHTLFLDACREAGISVWVGFPIGAGVYKGGGQPQDNVLLDRIRVGVQLLAEQLGQHPAVIGFTIGNETNGADVRSDPAYWAWLDGLAAIAKTAAPDKLTMTCLVDDGILSVAEGESRTPHIDVFGLNVYRGTVSTGMGSLFADYASKSARPLLLTEFGCPASTRAADDPNTVVALPERAAAQADYLRTQWQDIARTENRAINAGGYAFAWSDEWWKQGLPQQQDHNNAAVNHSFPGGYGDEEWFGLHAVSLNPLRAGKPGEVVGGDGMHHPDILTPRAAVDVLTALWHTGD
ncbi:hypothetical protein [Paracidovorax citrulli]